MDELELDLRFERMRLALKNAIALKGKDGVQPAELEAVQEEVIAIETALHALADRIADLEKRPPVVERIGGGVIVQQAAPGHSYMPSGW